MDTRAHSSQPNRPRIVIVGAGISGLALAAMLIGANAEIVVLEQVIPPRREHGFTGIVSTGDLQEIGISLDRARPAPVTAIAQLRLDRSIIEPDRIAPVWWAVEHAELLRAMTRRLARSEGTVTPGATVTEFLWKHGAVSGVRLGERGLELPADLVVLADESDPRLAEQLGLRPDWPPTELMHLAKVRFPLDAGVVRDRFGAAGEGSRIMVFQHVATWGLPGYGLVAPGKDSITVTVAMLLEDEMASARHIREYLDETLAVPVMRRLLAGSGQEGFFTEVVPTGGFDAKPRFHADRVLVVNDLVGVTNPINHDGLSANLAMCAAAARTIRGAIDAESYSGSRLAAYSKRITADILGPVNSARRTDTSLRGRAPWQWASKPELVPPAAGMTDRGKSETLPGASDSRILERLRKFGRSPGVRRHAPGEYDE